jgi:hypothetical protein
MKGLSLAGYKKIHEDKDWATLIHKDGHKIMIAKAPLSPIMRKQVENLETHQQNVYGGKVHLAEGGSAPDAQASSQPSEMEGIMGDVAANAPPPPLSSPRQSPSAVAVQTPSQMQTVGEAQNLGLTQEQKENLNVARIAGEEATEQAGNYGMAAQNLSDLPTQQENYDKANMQQTYLANAYRDQKVDPAQYWTGHKENPDDPKSPMIDGHSKLLAGIGILLSGAGQAIGSGSVQGNGALDAIQQGINREVDRQKNAQEQDMNLWKMNREVLGNAQAANLATQNQLSEGAKYSIAETAAHFKTPAALAAANLANTKIQQQIDANKFQLAMMNPSSDNPNPANHIQALTKPANQHLVEPALKEMSAASHIASNYPAIIDAHMQSWNDTKPGLSALRAALPHWMGGGAATPGQAAEAQLLGNTVVATTDSGRQAEFENVKNNLVNGLTDQDPDKGSKLNTLVNYIASKSESAPASEALGIDLKKFPMTNTTRQQVVNYIAQKYPDKLKYVLPSKTLQNGQKVYRSTR